MIHREVETGGAECSFRKRLVIDHIMGIDQPVSFLAPGSIVDPAVGGIRGNIDGRSNVERLSVSRTIPFAPIGDRRDQLRVELRGDGAADHMVPGQRAVENQSLARVADNRHIRADGMVARQLRYDDPGSQAAERTGMRPRDRLLEEEPRLAALRFYPLYADTLNLRAAAEFQHVANADLVVRKRGNDHDRA